MGFKPRPHKEKCSVKYCSEPATCLAKTTRPYFYISEVTNEQRVVCDAHKLREIRKVQAARGGAALGAGAAAHGGVKNTFRGNCPCGKWLVIVPSMTREKPLVCGGPCHADKECGIKYFVEDGELRTIKAKESNEPHNNGREPEE